MSTTTISPNIDNKTGNFSEKIVPNALFSMDNLKKVLDEDEEVEMPSSSGAATISGAAVVTTVVTPEKEKPTTETTVTVTKKQKMMTEFKKRELLPPDIERKSGKNYQTQNSKYNLANPIE